MRMSVMEGTVCVRRRLEVLLRHTVHGGAVFKNGREALSQLDTPSTVAGSHTRHWSAGSAPLATVSRHRNTLSPASQDPPPPQH